MNDRKYLRIIGNQPINGFIKISGSKNASLPLIAASLLIKGKTILNNVPRISDVFKMINILNYLNVSYEFKENTLLIDTTNMVSKDLICKEINEIRGSYYYIGPLLEENSIIKIKNVGGCNFSSRPINYHLDILKEVGVDIFEDENEYTLISSKFKKLDYSFKRKSVGATINAILIGTKTGKETIIHNYSREPEVICLINFLSKAGLSIEINEKSISFQRKTQLSQIEYDVIPDRIEAETFALLGLGLGKVGILDFVKEHHESFLKFLDFNNVIYEIENNYLLIEKTKIEKSNHLMLKEYPSLSTDIGPILFSSLLLGNKMFMIEDLVYPERLNKLTFFISSISFISSKLLANPVNLKCGHRFYGTNLRDSMAYLYYCLTHEGEFELYGLEHLLRGYEDIINKLVSLGCKVEMVDDEE